MVAVAVAAIGIGGGALFVYAVWWTFHNAGRVYENLGR